MRRVSARHTKPEMFVRRLLYGLGYRYRLHAPELPGRPDLAFRPRRKVVFVHGCFWHGHDCARGRRPSSNTDFWNGKLSRNAERDARNLDLLAANGWSALVVWECEIKDRDVLTGRLVRFLSDPTPP